MTARSSSTETKSSVLSTSLTPSMWTAPEAPHRRQRKGLADFTSRALQSHSSRNIRAGSVANIDHAIEHFRAKHLQEEDRKAAKLAAAAKKEEQN